MFPVIVFPVSNALESSGSDMFKLWTRSEKMACSN